MPSKTKSPRSSLKDIITYIELACGFTAGMSAETFANDKLKVLATTRCLEIISEASRRLPKEMHDRYPHIDWRQIAAAGNFYRHEYEIIKELEIWDTIMRDLRPLLEAAKVEIARLPEA